MRLGVRLSIPTTVKLNPGVELLNLYPGAAAAYSFRLLDTNYTGSAIRVRRADDNEESDIGFRTGAGSKILDTTTLEAFSLGGDCFVTTWYDQSGNANDMSESADEGQPKIVSNGSYLGYIDFNGVVRTLNSPFEMVYQNQFSSFIVAQSPEEERAVLLGAKENGFDYWNVLDSNTSSSFSGSMQSVTSYVNGSSIDTTRGALNESITSFALISTLAQYNTYAEPQYKLRFGYTSSSWHNFKCKEMVHYNNQSVERTAVEQNITTYYGF